MTVRGRRWAILILFLGALASPLTLALGESLSQQAPNGDPEKGRQIFHGRGICYYCHGQDGDPENLPELQPQTLRTIRGLRPHPPDLRRAQELKLKSDKERFLMIREGHEGTGMLPDTTLSNQEIRDVWHTSRRCVSQTSRRANRDVVGEGAMVIVLSRY